MTRFVVRIFRASVPKYGFVRFNAFTNSHENARIAMSITRPDISPKMRDANFARPERCGRILFDITDSSGVGVGSDGSRVLFVVVEQPRI